MCAHLVLCLWSHVYVRTEAEQAKKKEKKKKRENKLSLEQMKQQPRTHTPQKKEATKQSFGPNEREKKSESLHTGRSWRLHSSLSFMKRVFASICVFTGDSTLFFLSSCSSVTIWSFVFFFHFWFRKKWLFEFCLKAHTKEENGKENMLLRLTSNIIVVAAS